jgi:hypothetical protein
MGKQAKNKGGRPPKTVDIRTVEMLCAIQCTAEEICQVLDVDGKTLSKYLQLETGKGFSEFYGEKSSVGKSALRRAQYEMAVGRKAVYDEAGRLVQTALSPDKTMLIFLGKNWLKQRDVWETNVSARVEVEAVVTDPYAEIAELYRLYGKELEAILAQVSVLKAIPESGTGRGNGNGSGQRGSARSSDN